MDFSTAVIIQCMQFCVSFFYYYVTVTLPCYYIVLIIISFNGWVIIHKLLLVATQFLWVENR